MGALPQHGAQGHVREDRAARRQVREVRSRLGHARACRSSSRRSNTSASKISTRSIRSSCASKCKERALFWLDRQREHARAHGKLRALGPSVPHDRSVVRGDDRRRARRSRRKTADLQRACARRCGASTTKRRWPKPRSSTSRKRRRRSTCAFRANARAARAHSRTRSASAAASAADAASVRADLDDDAVDASRQRRDRAARRTRRTASTASATRRSLLAEALASAGARRAFRRARRWRHGRAGEQLDGLAVRHPFCDRDSVLVLADYVDLETGTGAVHTAPGHGADDFDTGVKYDLPILNPVDARRTLHGRSRSVRRHAHLRRQREDRRRSARQRRAVDASRSTSTRIRTAGAATIR